jgi:Rhamnan synthesis protein F
MGGSGVIPGWKLRREVSRLFTQIGAIPRRLAGPFVFRRYSRHRWEVIKQAHGQVPSGPKVCIFLLYQPRQLAGSVLETCDFLAAQGYSVLVVANGGLPSEAIEQLLPRTWLVLQRPNFGYDFGGYQDGVLFMEREGIVPDHLIILNDSIWFPMSSDAKVIGDLERSPYDVTGLLMHLPARNDAVGTEASEKPRRGRTEHIESYLISVRKEVFASPTFQGFWRTYVPSSSKHVTITRGEIGFSKAMAAAGLKVGALSDRVRFSTLIASRPPEFIDLALRYAAYSDDDLKAERDQLLTMRRGEDWCAAARDHILRTVRRRRFNASFCWASEQLFGTSFVKKNHGMLFQRSRIKYLEALSAGVLTADRPAALAELRRMVNDDLKSFADSRL